MSNELLYRLWGKTNEREKGHNENDWNYHPAICHMVDVAYVAETWLQRNPRLLDRFCQLAPGIHRDILSNIIVFVVALHDLGKFHKNFQAKSPKGWEVGYGSIQKKRPNDGGRGFDHGLGTAKIMRELFKENNALEWERWESVIDAVAAHHGTLFNDELGSPNNSYYSSINFEHENILEALTVLSALFSIPKDLPHPPKNSAFLMLIAGFCSVADWFGSDSNSFVFRPDISSFENIKDYLEQLRKNNIADRLLSDAGLLSDLRNDCNSYQDLFNFITSEQDLRPLQKISQAIPFGNDHGAEILVVEAPMGSGKTELALYHTACAISNNTADGLYFALPTQASSNAMLERIEAFAQTITTPGQPISLALAHGGRKFNEPYQKLRESLYRSREHGSRYGSKQDEERSAPSEVVAPSWLQSSKRTLLATIGVGTIDQTLLGALSARHSFVRLFALAGKVVVFDEIHAYDMYMNQIIERLLTWLGAMGCKVILLSATLPTTLRNQLITAFGCRPLQSQQPPEHTPYPLMVYAAGNTTVAHDTTANGEDQQQENTFPEKVIEINCIPEKIDNRTYHGAKLAIQLAEQGGCVAWIRNTVREAQEAWEMVRGLLAGQGNNDIEVIILHSRFTRHDRNKIEQNLVGALGKKKDAPRPKRLIAIATQVIEQSVDVDFDAMISDLAPIDLLLQRSGRLWRHEHRPTEQRHAHRSPVLHILVPNKNDLSKLEFGSSSYVYDAETLARSAYLLRQEQHQRWEIPAACRTLVAKLYDTPASEWTAERLEVDAERLQDARQKLKVLQSTMKTCAQKLLVMKPANGPLLGKSSVLLSDNEADSNIAVTTRYGGGGASLALLVQQGDDYAPYGSPDCRLTALPTGDNYRQMIALEEAVEKATVSFPWYATMGSAPLPETLAPFQKWWSDRRRYDTRVFVLLHPDGSIQHPDIAAVYPFDSEGNPTSGLSVRPLSQSSKFVAFEEL
ncbi:MAG: CRISPR-associated helicase Cas3' [Armatimonadetes bacterium]|nr:CRISPR-associated helicase Cas3' [Armatimonadota bacterium]